MAAVFTSEDLLLSSWERVKIHLAVQLIDYIRRQRIQINFYRFHDDLI